MASKALLPISMLRQLLRYDAETGLIFWRQRHRGKQTCATPDSYGYLVGCIEGYNIKAHRVAWALHFGEWPQCELDHINGIRSDNRLENLRPATRAQNGQNMGLRATNTSGHPGVSWHRAKRKWRSAIRADGCRHYLGYFDTPEAAGRAYAEAKARLHTFAPTVRADDATQAQADGLPSKW